MSLADDVKTKPEVASFIKEVASQVFVILLPTLMELIRSAKNTTISDERIAALSPKDPLEYFKCLTGCEDDRDCDGVKDDVDKCPDVGAPEGGCVTKDGCPDSDCDGVADDVDPCPDDPNCK